MMPDTVTEYGAFNLTKDGKVKDADSRKLPPSAEFNFQMGIQKAIESKFKEGPIDENSNLYDLVIGEMEKPLLEAVLLHTKNNHSQATRWLGLSRGTFREKLKRHGLLGKQKKSLLELNLIPKA